MRILHCCLAGCYIDGYNYQENVLTRINHQDGHTVRILASTETLIGNDRLGYVEPGTYATEFGVTITRVPYRRIINHYLSSKLRAYHGVERIIADFSPDVILYHGTGGLALLPIVKYKKDNPRVRLYMDSHEDLNNSARNWISKHIQHKIIHATLTRHAYRHLEALLYISDECKDFLLDIYKLPGDKLEFYPLGGVIMEGGERRERRIRKRGELGLDGADILLVHSGKMDRRKRTLDVLSALVRVPDPRFKLVLIGSMHAEVEAELKRAIQADARVRYLGWKAADELLAYLCACDVYVQPGSQSVTMQNAICCGAPVMIDNVKSHKRYIRGNGFLVETAEDMTRCFERISRDPDMLGEMSAKSLELAHEMLDYRRLAARVYR